MLDSTVPGREHPPPQKTPSIPPARVRVVPPRPTRVRVVFTDDDDDDFVVSPPTVPRLFHDETVLLPAFSPPRRRDDDDDDDGPDHGFHRKLPPGLIPRVDADVGNPPVGGVRMSHRQTDTQTHTRTLAL